MLWRAPTFGGRVPFGVEAPGRLPQVLDDVDEVDQDVHADPTRGRFGASAAAPPANSTSSVKRARLAVNASVVCAASGIRASLLERPTAIAP